MKLLNIDEDCPSEFYIFVNTLNPVTEHNFRLTGQFSSGAIGSLSNPDFLAKYISGKVRYLPYEPCQMDQLFISPYFLSAINDYRVEYDAEVYRERHHPLYPSRLSALYAFGDYETCIEVSRKYGWDINTVEKFSLIDTPFNRAVKVNMEHVSLARHAYRVSTLTEIDRLWGGYWSGFDNIILELPATSFTRQAYDSGIIWEYLIEGAVKHIK